MAAIGEEKVVRTVCGIVDGIHCGIQAHVRDGMLVKVEPASFLDSRFRHICARALCSTKLVYHPDRLKHPLKRVGERGKGRWQRVSWNEALDTIARRLTEIRYKYGNESVAFAIEVMPYVRLASALEATMINPIGFGDAAGPGADEITYGTHYAHLYTIDFKKPGMCVIWGGNFTETSPFWWRKIRDDMEKEAKLVVIDPRFTSTASKAHEYISIRPGTDAALVLGLIGLILERELHDRNFITKHTVGPFLVRSDNRMFLREKDISSGGSDKYIVWDMTTDQPRAYDEPSILPALTGSYQIGDLKCTPSFELLAALAKQYPIKKASEITQVPTKVIEQLAIEYATRKPVASYRGMGLQRTFHGDLSYRSVSTLAAVTGNINTEGYSEGYRRFLFDNGTILYGDHFPKPMQLLQLYESVVNEQPYPIKALWLAGHNYMNQTPDNNRVLKEIVPRLDLIVVADMFMNFSAQHADFVLPTCSFYEHLDLVTPIDVLDPYIQLQQKVIEPLYESKPDRDIVNELGLRLGLGNEFVLSAEQYIERTLSSGHPSVEGVTMQKLKQGPVEAAPYNVSGFATPSGKIEFYSERMLEFDQELPVYLEPIESAHRPLAKKYPLNYLSTHTKYGNHSLLANISWLRELDTEPLLEMNPADAERRRIKDGDTVVAFNDRGRVKLKVRVHDGIRPGVVNINEGWWHQHFVEGSFQGLTHGMINRAQMAIFEANSAMYDNLVEVKKADKE